MCGRARCTLRADDIPRACRLNGRPLRSIDMDRYRPSYNISPGRVLPVVRREDGAGGDGAVLHSMKWGLVPSFTKKSEKPDHYKMFNARSESICEKASFRRLVPNNRCLVAVEGFYEWKKDGSKRQPYYIHFKDGRPLGFAALYDSWKNSEGEILYTFTIVTTSSSSALEWLHDRMPVILGDKESTDAWLFGSSSSKFETVLKPYEEVDLVWYPVTPAMGKPSFDGPECIMEIKLRTEETMLISKFFSKKGSNSKRESNSEVASMCGEPIKTYQPGSLKVKPETEDNLDHPQESNSRVASMCGEPSKTHQRGSLKVEPKTEDNLDHPSLNDKDNDELKPDASTNSHGVANLPLKRDYEVFLDDTKPFNGEADKPQTSPVRKKGSASAGGGKQPTLFSYFGKR